MRLATAFQEGRNSSCGRILAQEGEGKYVTLVTSVHCMWLEEDKCTEHPEVSEGILDFSRRKGSKKQNKTIFKLWMQILPLEIREACGRGTEETTPRAPLASS